MYALYLHGDAKGTLDLALPAGTYTLEWIDVRTGERLPTPDNTAGRGMNLRLPVHGIDNAGATPVPNMPQHFPASIEIPPHGIRCGAEDPAPISPMAGARITLEQVIHQVGEAGLRLSEIGAADGSAGNISVYLGKDVVVPTAFDHTDRVDLPIPVVELAGGSFIVTGSGRRLREIAGDPDGCLAVLTVAPDGAAGILHTSERRRFDRITVEFNTHLAIHRDHVVRDSLSFHSVIHAQPTHLTYLSHIPEYRDHRTLKSAHPALGTGKHFSSS